MRILCVAAAGGHIEQMIECLGAFEGHEVVLAHYDWPNFKDFADPRISRRVGIFLGGDEGLPLIIGTVLSFFQWVRLLATYRPQVIFSTGAEIAIIPMWLGRILLGARCVFLETASRKERPSGTGPLVYPVSDVFFVQSPALLAHYGPKAKYVGELL
jgi:UDP-N-acetylglucosamine:LPS N-acetylglucosamine transferase